MTVSTVLRLVVLLLALAVGMTSSSSAEAQACRRSCIADEVRDARGCCIPPKKPKRTKKKTAPASTKVKSSRTRKVRRKNVGKKSSVKKTQSSRSASDKATKSDKANGGRPSESRGDAAPDSARHPNDLALTRELAPRDSVTPITTETGVGPGDETSEPNDRKILTPAVPEKQVSRTPTWIMLGVGAGLVLSGGALHLFAQANGDQFDAEFSEACPSGCLEADLPDRDSRLQHAKLQLSLGIGAYAVGGLVTAAGLVWFYLDRDRQAPPEESIALTPWADSSSFGVAAGLRF